MFNKEKVSIMIGGGLGDAFQTYFANPLTHCLDGEDGFPTSNHIASVWMRRLRDFKIKHKNVKVVLLLASHNKSSYELFETNPYLDDIIQLEWKEPSNMYICLSSFHEIRDYYPDHEHDDVLYPIELEYNPIHWFYSYYHYIADPPDLFLTEQDLAICKMYDKPYFVEHPYSSFPRNVLPIWKYDEFEQLAKDAGYDTIRLGSKFEGWEHNVRISIHLTINSYGFLGVHSAMCLSAWYAGLKRGIHTVCFIPNVNYFENISDMAVSFGFNAPFNKTYRYDSFEEAMNQDMKEVLNWLLQGSANK